MEPVSQLFQIHAAHAESLVADHFRRGKFVDFIQKIPKLFYFCNHKRSCGHICKSNPKAIGDIGYRHNIIILVQCLGVEICSRSNYPDYFPLYNALGFFRVFHLLADSYLIAFFHQPVNIIVRSMKGDAAHGRPLGQTTVLSRQG